ncbi:hypothetical protein EG329_005371 [Mollisiaceae sp. DMI_Dod_QoI]|nr:hypothetical protein EG329_005371 [Helotiales sp. DMI_Dod_QoI]
MRFVELMGVRRIEVEDEVEAGGCVDGDGEDGRRERFMSLNPSYVPGGNRGAAYGGHVFAQSVWAAAQTVGGDRGGDGGMVVHNVHGFFTLPGLGDRPYVYSITHLSEGRSYCTRQVTVRQPLSASSSVPFRVQDLGKGEEGLGKVCFVSMVSFKRNEVEGVSHQVGEGVEEMYREVLEGRRPESWDVLPRIDTPWYYRHIKQHPQTNDFPGLELRKVDMRTYNANKHPQDYRQLHYYTPLGPIPPTLPNLHACAHLYASDRNSVFVVTNATGTGDNIKAMGSLSHSVIFHVNGKDLVMREREWWCQESWTPRSGWGRGVVESRIWRGKTNVASTFQEGQVRWTDKEGEMRQMNAFMEGWREARGKL